MSQESGTGAGQETVTRETSGVGDTPQDAQNLRGATETQAGAVEALKNELRQKDSSLTELRAVQSGQDQKISKLQGQLEQLTTERDELKGEVGRLQNLFASGDDVKSEYEQQLAATRESAAAVKQDLSSQLETANTTLSQLQSENEKLKVLVAEHPNLAPLVEVGALPQAESVDDFREKLERLSSRFVAKEVAGEYQRQQGSRPPSAPSRQTQVDPDSAYERYAQLIAQDASREEIEEAKEAWYSAMEERGFTGSP